MKQITLFAAILALTVVVLGAYTRLSDAGLGCPDWPGCYGNMIVPNEVEAVAEASQAFPERPLEQGKAWKEMIHRYVAGTLGLFILYIAVAGWVKKLLPRKLNYIALGLVGLVLFQALLGMWTVTLLLKPVIVVAHLLGGMTILSLLYWLSLRQAGRNSYVACANEPLLLRWAIVGLVMVAIQITLGGWTSANYTALVCPDFPLCQGQWWPNMDFGQGFQIWHEPGIDYEGGVLQADAMTAIQVGHRIGALLTLLVVSSVAIKSIMQRNYALKWTGIIMLGLLLLQISFGIANVLLRLPLLIAVAHNGVAALLLLSMVTLLHHSRPILK